MSKATLSETRELARDLLRGSVAEDALAQFLALVIRQVHEDRIAPLQAEVKDLRSRIADLEAAQ